MKTLPPIRTVTHRDARRAVAVAVAAALAWACAGAAGGEPSAIHSYYYFVHWMSVSRPDLALQQFTDDAVVVAGPACTASAPCVGKAAIRTGYFGALHTGRVSLPVYDQRFEGKRLRARGEQFVRGDPMARRGYVFEFEGGRIASLKSELDASGPVAPARLLLVGRRITDPARGRELGPTPEGLLVRPSAIQEFRAVGNQGTRLGSAAHTRVRTLVSLSEVAMTSAEVADLQLSAYNARDIFLRAAEASDAEQVAEVLIDSRKAFLPFAPSAHTEAEVKRWVRDVLLRTKQVTVAVAGRTVVGVLALFTMDGHSWIEQLYIRPPYVGQGLGSMLLAHAIATAPAPIRLYTFQQNVGARRFYERHGFVAIGLTDGSTNEEKCPDVLYELAGLATGGRA